MIFQTALQRQNVTQFCTHKRHPISDPHGWAKGCQLCVILRTKLQLFLCRENVFDHTPLYQFSFINTLNQTLLWLSFVNTLISNKVSRKIWFSVKQMLWHTEISLCLRSFYPATLQKLCTVWQPPLLTVKTISCNIEIAQPHFLHH